MVEVEPLLAVGATFGAAVTVMLTVPFAFAVPSLTRKLKLSGPE